MKKAIVAFAIAGALVFSTGAHAQTQAPKFNKIAGIEDNKDGIGPTGDVSENDVNIRAVRMFRKKYPSADQVRWSENKGSYFVRFSVDGIKHKIAFDNSGDAEYQLKVYNAANVPAHIVKTMKLNYYDYEVKGAQELTTGSKTIHVVQLAGYKSWKTIRIADGEVEEIQNLREQ